MGFFTRTAMDALMKTSHPEINRRQCWNLHPHRKPCTTCKDICPYGEEIFTRPNLVKDWDPCTDCGLCVSACRSGCIAPSPEQVQRDTAAADTDSDTIWIGCEKSTRKNTVVRSCICALSWEALAYLALNKKIVLDLTPCGQCENDLCAEQLRKELTRLVDFFGQPMFEARFSLAYEEKEYPYHVQELTRREMLEQVSHGSKSGTKKLLQMLPGLRSEEDSGVDFRLLLHQRTKQLKAAMETPLQYGYYMPKFTDNCFGCGRCEKACRANALKFEEMPNGQTRMVLTPWKCSECGVCMNVCSNKGFDGMKLYQLTTLGPVVLHKCTKNLCKQCGKPIAPDSAEGLCSVCRIKARTLKRQEEARQRAEQLKAERAAKAAEEAANSLIGEDVATVADFDAAIAALDINKDTEASSTAYTDQQYASVSTTVRDWITDSARKEGDKTVIANTTTSTDDDGNETKTTLGYYAVFFTGSNDNTFPLVNVRHILVKFEGGTTDSTTGTTTYSDEEKNAAKEKAEEILDEWMSGDATEDSFAALANEKSNDGDGTTGGLYENVYPGQIVSSFNDWCFDASRQSGNTGIIESEYGYHVMYFVGKSSTTYRDYQIESELRSTDAQEWYDATVEAVPMTDGNTKYIRKNLIISAS